ncbi:MAG: hypothetical protein SFW62_07535 [Alphaproteobacteria bacterium]|nr:hypothetical protein [Alphaproteobacteria bacterium]
MIDKASLRAEAVRLGQTATVRGDFAELREALSSPEATRDFRAGLIADGLASACAHGNLIAVHFFTDMLCPNPNIYPDMKHSILEEALTAAQEHRAPRDIREYLENQVRSFMGKRSIGIRARRFVA